MYDGEARRVGRWVVLLATLLIGSVGTAADTTPVVPLFVPTPDAGGRATLRPAAIASLRQLARGEQVRIPGVSADDSGATVDFVLERFVVTTARTEFRDRADRALEFDPDRVVLLRGQIAGDATSHVFLAVSDLGIAGSIERGAGGDRAVLAGAPGSPAGLIRGPVRFVSMTGSGAMPPVPFCATDTVSRPAAAGIPEPAFVRRSLLLAVDTDYEFYRLFDDLDAAGAYVVALYGAVSDIFLRDVNAAIQLSVVRLWDHPDLIYDDPDPLFALITQWTGPLVAVPRAAVQFLTGRRDLPYGGVAYVDSLCLGPSYSVAGWLNGRFVDPAAPHAGNWDIVVAAHELGHNCGTGHTHDAGIDACASLELQRGTLMSYCHLTPGGVANIDLRFHTGVVPAITSYMGSTPCVPLDCNGNFQDDALDIRFEVSMDTDGNGVPDECQDCNANGTLDEQDILSGASLDLDENGVPDECEPDCNGNGVPDALDIAEGTSTDAYGNGIPDECELDANGNRVSDYTEIQADMSLDIDRNARLDAYEDCDGDGVTDLAELGGGLDLWVAGAGGVVREFHGITGVAIRDAEAPGLGPVADLVLGPDGRLYASRAAHDAIGVIDPVTGEYLGDVVPTGRGGLSRPAGLVVTPWGTLLVASRGAHAVLEYTLEAGVFVRAFVPAGYGGLVEPHGLAFTGDRRLVVSTGDGRILHYDGPTGTALGALVPDTSADLVSPRGMLVTPDGRLLVASSGNGRVLAYDVRDGTPLGRFDHGGRPGSFWSLRRPLALRLAPAGDVVYAVSNEGSAAIHAYTLDDGLFRRSYYVLRLGIDAPTALAVMPPSPQDCNANGRPDDCDVQSGFSDDANRNGVPDECEDGGLAATGIPALIAVLTGWGPCSPGCPADRDGNGVVDAVDLGLVLAAWRE